MGSSESMPTATDASMLFNNDMGSGAEALRTGGVPLATGQYASGTTDSTLQRILQAFTQGISTLGSGKTPHQLPAPAVIIGGSAGLTNLPGLDFSKIFAMLVSAASPKGGR